MTIKVKRGVKANLPILNVGEIAFTTDTNEVFIGNGSSNVKIINQTIANITYYVNPTTGSDANNGLSSSTPFKTLQNALNFLPSVINHNITINLSGGTYNEDVNINGYTGTGKISIIGGSVVANDFIFNSFTVNNCLIPLVIQGVKCGTTTTHGFNVNRVMHGYFNYCSIDSSSSSYNGFTVSNSFVYVVNCSISNRNVGIYCGCGVVNSDTNTGSGNGTGLVSQNAGTIGKNSTQPSGTTNEFSNTGGVIR